MNCFTHGCIPFFNKRKKVPQEFQELDQKIFRNYHQASLLYQKKKQKKEIKKYYSLILKMGLQFSLGQVIQDTNLIIRNFRHAPNFSV